MLLSSNLYNISYMFQRLPSMFLRSNDPAKFAIALCFRPAIILFETLHCYIYTLQTYNLMKAQCGHHEYLISWSHQSGILYAQNTPSGTLVTIKNNTYGLLFQDLDQHIFIDFSEIKITSDHNTIEANETTQLVMRDTEEFKTVHNLEKKSLCISDK